MAYKRNDDHDLTLWTDSSFADVSEDKSTGGYLVHFAGNLIHWRSKKMRWIANSSAESEYLAAYYGIKDTIKIGYLLKEFFGFKDIWPFSVYCDNQAVMQVVEKTSSALKITTTIETKSFLITATFALSSDFHNEH